MELTPGSTEKLTAIIHPEDARNKRIYFTSTNPAVATVNECGEITAHAAGTAVITAVSEAGNITANCKVTVVQKKAETTTGKDDEKTPDRKPDTQSSIKVGKASIKSAKKKKASPTVTITLVRKVAKASGYQIKVYPTSGKAKKNKGAITTKFITKNTKKLVVKNKKLKNKKGNIILKEGNRLYVNSKSNTQGTVTIEKADYTKVNEAKSKVPADLSVYTDESVKALQGALAAVVEDKDVTEQIAVNGYATSIENAIVGLKYKSADYTKVNEAKAKVPSDLSIYTDESVNALKDALALVEDGKNITEQATVDGYADAINKAIEGLVKKPIIYKVIEGEGGTFVKKSGKDISIRIDHEYTENVKVEVDDQEVDKVHYKVTKGSTTITFGDMYLNTLAVGTHHVKVTFKDGYATTTLIIKEQTKNNNEKKDTISNNQEIVKAENKKEVKKVNTGDNTNIVGITLLLVGSLIVLIYLNKKKTA